MTYVGQIGPALSNLGINAQVVSYSDLSSRSDLPAIDISKIATPLVGKALLRAIRRVPQSQHTTFALVWKLARVLTEMEGTCGLDLVEMEESFGAAWLLQELIAVPVVVRLHGPWFVNGAALGLPVDARFRKRAAVERRCITEAAGLTSPSRDLLERVRREYDMALANAAVIPNSAPRIRSEQRWSLQGCNKKSILFVGRFDRHKGGDIVIDGFREVAEVLPDVTLTFVGPDRGFRDDAGNTLDIQSYIERRVPPAVRARLHVRGPLPAEEIEKLRREAFVTVVASRYENFSLALLESLSFGCPTVASDVGGNVEILLTDTTGLLFAAGAPWALAAKILEMFRNPERAAQYGAQGAKDMANRLSPESVARATIDYYESVWRARPRARQGVGVRFRRAIYQLTGVV